MELYNIQKFYMVLITPALFTKREEILLHPSTGLRMTGGLSVTWVLVIAACVSGRKSPPHVVGKSPRPIFHSLAKSPQPPSPKGK